MHIMNIDASRSAELLYHEPCRCEDAVDRTRKLCYRGAEFSVNEIHSGQAEEDIEGEHRESVSASASVYLYNFELMISVVSTSPDLVDGQRRSFVEELWRDYSNQSGNVLGSCIMSHDYSASVGGYTYSYIKHYRARRASLIYKAQ